MQSVHMTMIEAPGIVLDFAGSEASVPSGWLICGGQAVSRTTYAALFAVIGTTYGAGNGTTTFNVPDLRSRVIAGKDDMGGSAASRLTNTPTGGVSGSGLGNVGGSQGHVLQINQLPAHTHNIESLGSRNLAAGGGDTVAEQGSGYPGGHRTAVSIAEDRAII